jgi:hypothetical protein
MASPVAAVLCALMAVSFWTLVGLAIARHLLPRPLALGAATVIGWAIHSAAALPVYMLVGFSTISVIGIGSLCILAAGFSLTFPVSIEKADTAPSMPVWAIACVCAAALASVPAIAILPKYYGDAVALADPIFDHSKSAIIDVMVRLGVPPINPFFGEAGATERLAYYYLWHFSAAELALVGHTSGWEADVGLTGFTAFSSLTLMMGIALWLSKRNAAAFWVVGLATTGSLWISIFAFAGTDDLRPVLAFPIGMSGWLFQATWVPQHLMAGSCAVAAMLVLGQYVKRQRLALVLTLALIVAAGFESSSFVGGVTFIIAALFAAPLLVNSTILSRRLPAVAGLALAAALAICLVAPFVFDQLATIRARDAGQPIVISPYAALGDFLPQPIRLMLDLPAYWLLIVPIELPAAFVAGVIAIVTLLRCATLSQSERHSVSFLSCLAGAGLVVSWLLKSTLGDNNDLGLRAIIPAIDVLIACTAAVAAMPKLRRLRAIVAAIAVVGLAFSLPDAVTILHNNVVGKKRLGGREFARSPELWAAVRRYAPPQVRVANNPLFLKDETPWPVNISWALLADRSSCFAGGDLALPYAPLTAERRKQINAQFIRVFDGSGTADDVHDLAARYHCAVVVLTPSDGAWDRDPFAVSPDYRLAETRESRWRIYVSR